MVDFSLTTGQDEIIESARAVARRCLEPRADEYDRSAAFPTDNFTDLATADLLGLLIPAEHGGRGADTTTYALTVAELAQACGSTALVFAMHCGATRLLSARPEPVVTRVFDEILTQGRLLAWGFSEPGTGGNVLTPHLRAQREEDGFTLAGTKAFCTGAGYVDYYLINTHSGEEEFHRSQSMFLLPADQPGLDVKESWDALGMRANNANTVLLDSRVPEELCVGGHGGGMPLLAHSLPALVLGLAATSLGVARAASDFATSHVTRRIHATTGSNLAAYQGVRMRVAEMATTLHTAYLALLYGASMADKDPMEALPAMNMAKYICNKAAIDVADHAMQITGGQGYLRANPLERHYRDARAGSVMGANLDALADMIGKSELGLDPRGS